HPDLDARRWFRRLPPDGTILFESDRFDAVAAAWVLEHVTDPAGFLSEVARVLKPGGHFVALTPHAWHYATWLIRAVGRLPHRVTQGIVERLYGRAERDTFPTVYRLNTRGRLTTAARAAGLEVTELVAFANPDYFRFARSARRAAIVTDRFLDHLAFGLGRLYLVAVLRKPAGTVSLTRMSAA
ncbi:MAG TPA: class I SAM-dependent methyltransferase, partial [Gemmataceae bacterium]|nr:class I SAM-dependent methyltransferase [Gemmataceae bacterium]